MKVAILAISVAALGLMSVDTAARAAVVTFDCVDVIVRVDTKAGTATEIDPSSKSTAVSHQMQLDNENLTWGMDLANTVRINRKTGLMYHLEGGSWIPDPDPTPCRQK
jgi:hypothetical protein